MASPSLSPVSELCQITIARLPTTPDHPHHDDDHHDDDDLGDDDDRQYQGPQLISEKCVSQTCALFLAQRAWVLERGGTVPQNRGLGEYICILPYSSFL